jgi:hypothetical protein
MPSPAPTPRCSWCGDDPLYVAYHDTEWGFPVADDRRLFEKLCCRRWGSSTITRPDASRAPKSHAPARASFRPGNTPLQPRVCRARRRFVVGGASPQPEETIMQRRNVLSLAATSLFAAALALPAHAQSTTSTVSRSKGADGAVDATRVGPKGGVTTVDRSKNADGTTNAVVTKPNGQVSSVTRSKDASGATDAVRSGAKGTATVDRTRNPDGTVDKTVTRSKAP